MHLLSLPPLLPLLLLLAACQSDNPYQASSLPLPPAPAAAANSFDASFAPAADKARWHAQLGAVFERFATR